MALPLKGGICQRKVLFIWQLESFPLLFRFPSWEPREERFCRRKLSHSKGNGILQTRFYDLPRRRQQEEAAKIISGGFRIQKAISVNPGSEEAHRNLARFIMSGKISKRLQKNTRKSTSWILMILTHSFGLTLTKMNRFEDAIAQLENAKNLDYRREGLAKIERIYPKDRT